jgi:hypothetical protein
MRSPQNSQIYTGSWTFTNLYSKTKALSFNSPIFSFQLRVPIFHENIGTFPKKDTWKFKFVGTTNA